MPQSPSAVEVPIKDLFSRNYLFNIPGYQRPYEWTDQQASELFDDLWSFLDLNPEPATTDQEAQDKASTYFLGSLVLIKEKDKPEATVVDGQQRLTTLTLLLSAIRAANPSHSEALDEFIWEKGNVISRLPDRYRLQLRSLDNDFFKKYVQQPGGFAKLLAIEAGDRELNTDAKKRIRENATLFAGKLKSLSDQQRLDFAMFIANRCYLVAVSTPDFRSAFRIFTVLNNRGLDLAPTDILKAQILERISEKAPKELNSITTLWETMEVELGRGGFLELFAHIRSILRKTKAQGSLLDELTADLKNRPALEFVKELLIPSKTAFLGIRDADYQNNETGSKVNEYLAWLNRVDFQDWVPPAIAFWMRHEKSGALMKQFFADLERLTYSMVIRRESDTTRIARFGQVTKAIEAGNDVFASDSPLQLSPVEQWQTYRVLDGMFYLEIKSGAARRAVLLRLDSLVATGEAKYDHPIISVEHVLPQTPPDGSLWLTWFPTAELRAYWTHRIGNLVLLAKSVNSSARNYEFERKKTSYFVRKGVTTFALTTPVIARSEWNPDICQTRQQNLVKILEDHWRLQGRKSPADALLDDL